MVVGMALNFEQDPVRQAVCRVPSMEPTRAFIHLLTFSVKLPLDFAAAKTVVLNVIGIFDMKGHPDALANVKDQCYIYN